MNAWRPIAEQFARHWNFHHAVGALDGKHIAITCPKQAGLNYYNYKQFHSIIMMALVDAEYKFSWVDIGSMGSAGDANVFNHSELRGCIDDDTIGFPASKPLPQDGQSRWNLQLPTLQGTNNSGERLWDPGTQVPVPADNPEAETNNCGIYCAGLRVPPHYDNTQKPQTTKRGS